MSEEEITRLEERLASTVVKTVNGKIDRLHEKIDNHNTKHEEDMNDVREHMKQVQPYLQGAAGIRVLGEALKWVAGLSVVWIAVKGIIPFK